MSESQSGRGASRHLTREPLQDMLRPYQGRKGVLLEIFHRVQDAYGYVPPEAMEPIARTLRMHAPTVYGTLTFYTEFKTSPPPAAQIEICLGPTCHLLGAPVIREVLEYRLGIDKAGGTPDNATGLREVECAGHCHLAPLLYLNGAARGNVGIADAAALAEEARTAASVGPAGAS